MSYFGAKPGKRPGDQPVDSTLTKEESNQPTEQAPALFRANLGQRTIVPAKPTEPAIPAIGQCCPLCQGAVQAEQGRWRCQGRCGATWVLHQGQLVDLAGLPYGSCCCCAIATVLIQTDQGLICPHTLRHHLLLASGPQLLDIAAPHGVCRCCHPPMPLIEQAGILFCSAKPAMRYQLLNGTLQLLAASASQSQTERLQAIDTALRRNSATVAINGLFDLDDQSEYDQR